jgi:hypothetical protein
MGSLTKERLLAEIEDIIRTMPAVRALRDDKPENHAWLGRASAAISNWNAPKSVYVPQCIDQIIGPTEYGATLALRRLTTLLNEARHDLILQIPGTGNTAISTGMTFDYFDEIRKIIELANQDVMFVDPYLDADFVSRYLPHVSAGVAIRLLAREKLATLLPAVDAFSQQAGRKVGVRLAQGFHDRYLIIDGTSCYQSGASFKDGAKKAPTTVTQIIDAFEAVKETYEKIWAQAQVQR